MDQFTQMVADSRPPAPPSTTRFALGTELARVDAGSVLEWLHRERRSGFVRVIAGDHRKAVYLHEGAIGFAESNQRIDRLGPALVRAGLLSVEALRGANRDAHADERFGKTLVNRGDLEPRQLWEGIRAQVEEIVFSLFAYREGVLGFWEGTAAPDNLVRIEFDTTTTLTRGREWARDLSEWIADARDGGSELRIAATVHAPGGDLGARHAEQWNALEGVDAHIAEVLREASGQGRGAQFDAVVRYAGVDALTVARTLRFLEGLGLVVLTHSLHVDDRESDDGFERCRSRLAHLDLVVDGLAEPLRRVRDRDAVWLRVREAFDEIVARFPGALTKIILAPDLALPVDQIEKQIRGGPLELAEDHFAAIDAFVDYLEFEVLNHEELDGAAILDVQHRLRQDDDTPARD